MKNRIVTTSFQLQRDFLAELIRWAEDSQRVRAMIMTSTRASNPDQVDLLSDYDVILYVTDIDLFGNSEEWLSELGTVLIRTTLEQRTNHGATEYWRGVFFDDMTKVDFTVTQASVLSIICSEPELPAELDLGFRVLVDKDNMTASLKAPTHKAYIPRKPSESEFRALVETFWWIVTYAAKYLWRDQAFAAKAMLDSEIRLFVLQPLLEWVIQTEHNWSIHTGAFGRQIKKYMKPEMWELVEKTYAGADKEDTWRALIAMTVVFREGAELVGRSLGYEYPHDIDARMLSYVRGIRELPQSG